MFSPILLRGLAAEFVRPIYTGCEIPATWPPAPASLSTVTPHSLSELNKKSVGEREGKPVFLAQYRANHDCDKA
jgi:hypothetical protein